MSSKEPRFAVIFTSLLHEIDEQYVELNVVLEEEAKLLDGFIRMDSVRNGLGISVSYWTDMETIDIWKKNTRHQVAKKLGVEKWYEFYRYDICQIIHSNEFKRNQP